MKAIGLFVFACLASAQNQPPAATPPAVAETPKLPDLPDATVLATFEDGTDFTVGDFKRAYFVLPEEQKPGAIRDRTGFIKQLDLMRRMTKMAEDQKLDQKHPNDDALRFQRMLILTQALINEKVNTVTVKPEEIKEYYEANKVQYSQVRVKAIYIGYSAKPVPVNGKTPLTEAQAKAKMEKLVAQIRGGADFVQMVKQNSEDESRARDGDFATLRPADSIPDEIKNAVFALKKSEITDPIRQPNGFYIFRAEEVTVRPFDQVRDEIFNTLKQKTFGEWMEKMNNTKIIYRNAEFLGINAVPNPPKQ